MEARVGIEKRPESHYLSHFRVTQLARYPRNYPHCDAPGKGRRGVPATQPPYRILCGDYQRFLKGHNLTCSMSGVGSCADNAACEGSFGMLKRERVNRRRYETHAEARADIFDYIECFYNPRRRRKLEIIKQKKSNLLTQPSVVTG